MATEEFGSIVVSGDYKGKLKEIVDALNTFDWSSDDVGDHFLVSDDNRIAYSSSSHVRIPTVFATRIVVKLSDGRTIPIDEVDKNATKDEEDMEYITPEWVSKNVCPLLKSGTLEIVAVAGGSHRGWVDRLIIRADGFVERSHEKFDSMKKKEWRKVEVEQFSKKKTKSKRTTSKRRAKKK